MSSLWLCVAIFGGGVALGKGPPHVILILADDMGWNDVSFHGSNQIPTPNIDALAYNGVLLNRHYSAPMCTPSRSSLLTGKYPFHLGMQHLVIVNSAPWGLSPNETILPQLLQKAGYESHIVGKWHLGFHKKEYTPTYRGFKSHYGYWTGYQGYLDHTSRGFIMQDEGYDMRRNLGVDWSAKGRYSTDLFTEEAVKIISEHNNDIPLFLLLSHLAVHTGTTDRPLVAPDEYIAKFSHIEDPKRRVYAAMVAKLDESVGEVVATLRRKDMLDNSIVIFLSDNGGPTVGNFSNTGSNYPLRGTKGGLFEGGSRVAAALWSPLIQKPQRVAQQLMHISDWVPTLCSVAGITLDNLTLDGVDMWESLSQDLPSPRNEIVYNIDEISNFSALRLENWKYIDDRIASVFNKFGSWYGDLGRSSDKYDVEAVFKSKAGAALAGFSIEKHISGGDKQVNAIPLLNRSKALEIRRQSQVECKEQSRYDSIGTGTFLFDLDNDPCEANNLAKANPKIIARFEKRLKKYRKTLVPTRFLPEDELSNPKLHGGVWANWQDIDEPSYCFSCVMMTLTAVIILIAIRSSSPHYAHV